MKQGEESTLPPADSHQHTAFVLGGKVHRAGHRLYPSILRPPAHPGKDEGHERLRPRHFLDL